MNTEKFDTPHNIIGFLTTLHFNIVALAHLPAAQDAEQVLDNIIHQMVLVTIHTSNVYFMMYNIFYDQEKFESDNTA